MRLTCSQKSLADALIIANKAVNPNNTLPVLNNVLLRAEGKKLYFAATNLEIAIDCSMDADVKNEGELTVPARLFSNYIKYLKDESVDLAAEEGNVITIKTADSSVRMKGLPAAEFPPIPTVDSDGEVVLSASDFKHVADQVVFAASLNTSRPILSGVYCRIDKNSFVMVATDSYRLSEKAISVKKPKGVINCIIPAVTIMELSSIIDSGNVAVDEIKIVVSKNQALFVFGDTRLTSRLIEGQFPNYQQIIPKNSKSTVQFNVEDFSSALKRVNIFAKENNNKILLKISKDAAIVTTDSTQYGDGEVTLKAKVEGAAVEIALNSQYLLEALTHLDKGDVLLEIGEKTNPVILRAPKDTGYTHIIMPLKI